MQTIMLLLKLSSKNTLPVYKQIVEQVKDLIIKGTLKAGDNLPSTRILADKHGINRTTVYKAYQELWASGYIESIPGSYTKIRERYKLVSEDDRKRKGLINWESISSKNSKELFRWYDNFTPAFPVYQNYEDVIKFNHLSMDNRIFPVGNFRKCINKVLNEKNTEVLNYADGLGNYKLREFLSQRLKLHKINTLPEELLITNGSQQGIELVLKTITSDGDTIAVESPTYSNVLPLFKLYGLKIIPIPMNNDGMDLDYLEKVLKNKTIKLIYTIPNFHNPTGISTNQVHRERLLNLCEKNRVPILEDGFEEEMKYFGKIFLPLKSMDSKQIVIYLGTFSKVLFPGIRLGWVSGDSNLIKKIAIVKKFCDLSTNSFTQSAMYEFCNSGYYDLHIKKMQRIFSKRMKLAIKLLNENLPKKIVEWTEPSGGYLIWLKFKKFIDAKKLENALRKIKICVAPGSRFFPVIEVEEKYLRLSISTLNEDEITTGIKNLGKALKEFI